MRRAAASIAGAEEHCNDASIAGYGGEYRRRYRSAAFFIKPHGTTANPYGWHRLDREEPVLYSCPTDQLKYYPISAGNVRLEGVVSLSLELPLFARLTSDFEALASIGADACHLCYCIE